MTDALSYDKSSGQAGGALLAFNKTIRHFLKKSNL